MRGKIMSLNNIKPGEEAVVLSLNIDSPHERNKLMALGVLPGASLRLIQRFPSYVISIGYTQIALDKETAKLIYVQPE
jgi:Fe2+ transport system protein FeoA